MYGVAELPPVSANPASAGAPWGLTSGAGLADGGVTEATFGASQVAWANVTVPSTSATFSFNGLTETLSSSAVAAAVRDVVDVLDRSRLTDPTPAPEPP